MPATLTAANGVSRPSAAATARATSSLPTPVSPSMSTLLGRLRGSPREALGHGAQPEGTDKPAQRRRRLERALQLVAEHEQRAPEPRAPRRRRAGRDRRGASRQPLTQVPLREPASATRSAPPARSTRRCALDTSVSSRPRSASQARPTTLPESGSANAAGRGNAHTSAGRRAPALRLRRPAVQAGARRIARHARCRLPRALGARKPSFQKTVLPSSPQPGSSAWQLPRDRLRFTGRRPVHEPAALREASRAPSERPLVRGHRVGTGARRFRSGRRALVVAPDVFAPRRSRPRRQIGMAALQRVDLLDGFDPGLERVERIGELAEPLVTGRALANAAACLLGGPASFLGVAGGRCARSAAWRRSSAASSVRLASSRSPASARSRSRSSAAVRSSSPDAAFVTCRPPNRPRKPERQRSAEHVLASAAAGLSAHSELVQLVSTRRVVRLKARPASASMRATSAATISRASSRTFSITSSRCASCATLLFRGTFAAASARRSPPPRVFRRSAARRSWRARLLRCSRSSAGSGELGQRDGDGGFGAVIRHGHRRSPFRAGSLCSRHAETNPARKPMVRAVDARSRSGDRAEGAIAIKVSGFAHADTPESAERGSRDRPVDRDRARARSRLFRLRCHPDRRSPSTPPARG